jgi:hypothetical protein
MNWKRCGRKWFWDVLELPVFFSGTTMKNISKQSWPLNQNLNQVHIKFEGVLPM